MSRDSDYYRQRAAAERALAASSSRADVAAIHAELARQYEALVEHQSLRPVLHIRFGKGVAHDSPPPLPRPARPPLGSRPRPAPHQD